MEILKDMYPTARKQHTCMYCGCKIEKGEKYRRATIKDDYIYDWVCHNDCDHLAYLLGLYDDDESVTEFDFRCAVSDYIDRYQNNDISTDLKKLSLIEQVRFLINEIEKGTN